MRGERKRKIRTTKTAKKIAQGVINVTRKHGGIHLLEHTCMAARVGRVANIYILEEFSLVAEEEEKITS